MSHVKRSKFEADKVFSRLVKEARTERGWTQEQTATEAGVLRSIVSYVEGGGGVTLRNALDLSAALGIKLDEI
jgi:transcriptional regulator with XRE-family HTH domain